MAEGEPSGGGDPACHRPTTMITMATASDRMIVRLLLVCAGTLWWYILSAVSMVDGPFITSAKDGALISSSTGGSGVIAIAVVLSQLGV